MADHAKSQEEVGPVHRGRIQAQGGGTEKSESWSRNSPPTEGELLRLCDNLEAQLTAQEKSDREAAMGKLRQFIRSAAQGGGMSAPASKSWRKRGSRDVRIDLEIIKGLAAVPDARGPREEETDG